MLFLVAFTNLKHTVFDSFERFQNVFNILSVLKTYKILGSILCNWSSHEATWFNWEMNGEIHMSSRLKLNENWEPQIANIHFVLFGPCVRSVLDSTSATVLSLECTCKVPSRSYGQVSRKWRVAEGRYLNKANKAQYKYSSPKKVLSKTASVD